MKAAEDGNVGEADPSRVEVAPEETPEAKGKGAAEYMAMQRQPIHIICICW